MKLLAVDTSSNACSVALQVADDVLESHVVEPRAHTKILLPMISQLLADGGVALTELDAIVLGNGPGSFIGMRIGASVVQGLCFGAGIGVLPVSSLATVAAEAFADNACERVIVAQDARMNEVYVGCFDKSGSGLPEPVKPEEIIAVGELPTIADGVAVAGTAWEKYPELLQADSCSIGPLLSASFPRARYLLRLGAVSAAAGGSIPPEDLMPAYLRTKVAEIPSRAS
jgi:tRNA threonylcarbamoyladenosine biosynthesis protein TsaB